MRRPGLVVALFLLVFNEGLPAATTWAPSPVVSDDPVRARDHILHEILRAQHPLPTDAKNIDVEDFLWTGSGDGDDIQSLVDLPPGFGLPSSPAASTTAPTFTASARTPADVLPETSNALEADLPPLGSVVLPDDRFLVRTVVLSNMTVIHNGIERFKQDMEHKLTRAYRNAYTRRRYRRSSREDIPQAAQEGDGAAGPTVRIHNIKSGLPEPKIEMIYSVYRDEALVPASEAVAAMTHLSDSEVSSVLGFPLVTKAEPYTAQAQALAHASTDGPNARWFVAAVVASSLLAGVVLVAMALLLLQRHKATAKSQRLLVSCSPSQSNSEAGTARRDGSIGHPDFALDEPHLRRPEQPPSSGKKSFLLSLRHDHDVVDAKRPESAAARSNSRSPSVVGGMGGRRKLGGDDMSSADDIRVARDAPDSPTLADLSSNNSPELSQGARAKTAVGSRRGRHGSGVGRKVHKRSRRVGEDVEQSAFPARTPDKEGFIGPLNDLLEEEIMLPGDSRHQSASQVGSKDWAYLPTLRKSPSTTSSSSSLASPSVSSCLEMEEAATQVSPTADLTVAALTSEAKRAVSAKSHLFRKGKVEATVHVHSEASRPWSAHESRLQADPIFSMRRRHWEGLIAGKKTLHHGKLLPGSTSEEELRAELERARPKAAATCWSECTSPRKQVRLVEPQSSSLDEEDEDRTDRHDPTAPIIKAIREELQRFHRPRSPNLTGISIISDPDLLNKESEA